MRMRHTILLVLLAAIVVAVQALPSPVAAQRPIPPPCFDCWWAGPSDARLTRADASVDVEDGRYRTSWTLTFAHPSDIAGGGIGGRFGPAEGRVIVPLPPDSVVTDLTLGDGTQTLEGRLLDADDASRIYEEIVRRLIDPALLRSLGDDLYEIKAFPVPRGETRTVTYTVTTPLTAEGGEAVIEAPWSRMSPRPAAASLSAQIDVPWEVRSAIAPGHVPAVVREGSGQLSVSWESPDGWTAERDFRLHLAGGEGLVDARLLAHRSATDGDEDGYFALLLAPALETDEQVARDIVIVLDRSGSMQGEKIVQARDAAIRILDRLGAGDRFGIVSFSSSVSSFEGMLHPASNAEQGREWVKGIRAEGLTNISGALGEAMDLLPGDRPATVVFLTDGLPTAGVEDRDGIVAAASATAPEQVQLFAFGVGYDVDAVLLDSLTSRFTGSSHYVTPDERIDTEVGLLSERISSPVLLGTALSFELPDDASEPTVSSLAPVSLGGIFAGEQTLITGRYQGSGAVTVVLTGQAAEGEQRFAYELSLPESADDAGVALLWAQRRIADLLTELRIEGQREGLIEEIIAIANRFGIVTPYTSYLAEEPDFVFNEPAAMDAMADDAAAAPSSGRAAVDAAEAVAELEEGATEHITPDAARLVGTRTYYLASYLSEDMWIEEGFDRSGPEPDELLLDVAQLAQLLSDDPHLVAASALGTRVVALGADGWVLLTWPDVTEPTDTGTTDTGTTDTEPTDTEPTDTGTTDTGTTDTGTTDTGTTDTGTTDTGTTDTGTTDTGTTDTGTTDTGTTDAGTTDTGTTDSGTTDTGTTDTGTTDTGTTDTGTTDTGTDGTTSTGDEPAEPASDYVVQPGDYLSKIAAHCYGDGSRWREIWEANRDRVMDDGRTFSNPNLIYIGWTLSIPDGCTPE